MTEGTTGSLSSLQKFMQITSLTFFSLIFFYTKSLGVAVSKSVSVNF